jgi:hypothetical protein
VNFAELRRWSKSIREERLRSKRELGHHGVHGRRAPPAGHPHSVVRAATVPHAGERVLLADGRDYLVVDVVHFTDPTPAHEGETVAGDGLAAEISAAPQRRRSAG